MTQHDQKSAEALQTALQMELEGKQFYSQSAESSSSQLARDLFQHLASLRSEPEMVPPGALRPRPARAFDSVSQR